MVHLTFMPEKKGKAVVTGGAGFIGSHIVDALIERGFETHVIDNYAGGKREDRFNPYAIYHEVDVRDFDAIAPIIKDAEYVFHEAALPRVQYSIEQPLETFSVNVQGLAAVLRAAHEGGVKRVVNAASSSAYGDQEIMPLTEDLPVMPKSPYGLQKHISELMCRTWSEVYGLSTVSLRYFNVYGARFDPEGAYALVIGKFLAQRKRGEPLTITGDGSQTRDFTHVRDVVRANLLAAESAKVGKGEIINIGAGKNMSINDLAKLIGGPVEHIAPRVEPHDTCAGNKLAKQLLDWEPAVSLEDGIAELKAESALT